MAQVHIHDLNWQQYVTDPVVDGVVRRRGLVPRNYGTHPVCYSPVSRAFEMDLIAQSEWSQRCADMKRSLSRIQDLRGTIKSRDQNGKGYCWQHSGGTALVCTRFLAGEPYVDISPYMGACIQKNYQDEGGWGAQGVDWICQNGLPDSQFWPQQSMSRSNDTPEMRTNAKLHRFTEGFWDLSAAQYDRNLTWNQVATCLLCRIPVVTDYNWWSHSVCAIELIDGASEWGQTRDEVSGKLLDLRTFNRVWGMDDPVTAGFGVLIWNSWGDSWSDRGMGPISGSKAVPDGSVAPRVSTPSVN